MNSRSAISALSGARPRRTAPPPPGRKPPLRAAPARYPQPIVTRYPARADRSALSKPPNGGCRGRGHVCQDDGLWTTGYNVPALEFAGLVKRFGDNVAVDHVDLTVPAGSFFGLVGPNGAGKTTSLSMAVGLLRPDGGTVRIFGRDVWADPVAAKALIGVLPDGMALPDRLSGREILLYLGLLRGMPREVVTERADELLQVLELDTAEGTAVVDYSTGMRKKITLATALL